MIIVENMVWMKFGGPIVVVKDGLKWFEDGSDNGDRNGNK